MKIKIPTAEYNRYVDLMGDPIHQNKLVSTVISPEFGLAAGTAAVGIFAHPDAATIKDFLISNFLDIPFHRFIFDRWAIETFLTSKTLEDICIDKNPTSAHSFESMTKYGLMCRNSRNLYMMFTALDIVRSIISSISPQSRHAILHQAAEYTRDLRGLYRFNKILSGEWAIVSTPEKQEKIKEYFEFEIPEFKPAFRTSLSARDIT